MKVLSIRSSLFAGLLAMAAAIASLAAPPALAQEEQPDAEAAKTFIRELADETLGVLRQPEIEDQVRKEEFTELLEKGVNTDYVSRFVLGRSWRTASAAERQEFVDLFKRFLLANLTERLAGAYDNHSFRVLSAVTAGRRDVLVRSEILRSQGPKLPIEWRVRKFGDHWQIIDIKAEGLSLAITQREEYSAVVQRKGMDGLLSALRSQVEALEGRDTEAELGTSSPS